MTEVTHQYTNIHAIIKVSFDETAKDIKTLYNVEPSMNHVTPAAEMERFFGGDIAQLSYTLGQNTVSAHISKLGCRVPDMPLSLGAWVGTEEVGASPTDADVFFGLCQKVASNMRGLAAMLDSLTGVEVNTK